MELTASKLGSSKKAGSLIRQMDAYVDAMHICGKQTPGTIYLHQSDIKWIMDKLNGDLRQRQEPELKVWPVTHWRGVEVKAYSG